MFMSWQALATPFLRIAEAGGCKGLQLSPLVFTVLSGSGGGFEGPGRSWGQGVRVWGLPVAPSPRPPPPFVARSTEVGCPPPLPSCALEPPCGRRPSPWPPCPCIAWGGGGGCMRGLSSSGWTHSRPPTPLQTSQTNVTLHCPLAETEHSFFFWGGGGWHDPLFGGGGFGPR